MSRHERVSEAIRREISTIIHDELKDPRLGFVTVVKVALSPDMRYVKVFFSVLGKEEERKSTKEALDSALGFVRRLVAERINLRFAPEITFQEDTTSEYSISIEKALEEIRGLHESTKGSRVRKKK